MGKLIIEVDTAAGTATVKQADRAAATVPTLQDWAGEEPKWSAMTDDAVCLEDYWYRGRLGIQRGAIRGQWSTAWMILSMMGNAHPEADVLCAPTVDDAAHRAVNGWSANIKYPWQLGWAPQPEAKPTGNAMTWEQWKQILLSRGTAAPAQSDSPTDPTTNTTI